MPPVSPVTTQSTVRGTLSTQAAQNNTLSIHVGGGAIGAFVADTDGTGGTISTTSSPIDVSAANAAPAGVYQAQRYGSMTYTIPGFTPSGTYTVRLHFAEMYWGANGRSGGAGSRKFNVAINGKTVLSNFDVFAAAGAANKAVVVDEPSTADANGMFTIALTNGSADNAMLNGVQILPVTLNDVQAANVGGGAIGVFAGDTLPNGAGNGIITTTTAAINVSAPNAAPALVYQSQRYGPMQRTFTGLTPGAAYTVRLHFAELYWGTSGHPGAGQREFNVAINGTTVLTNFDVYASAGAAQTAVVRDFAATADKTGTITLTLTNGARDNAMINGVEILGQTSGPPPITVGSETPHASDAFVDSIGINVHFADFQTLYANFSLVKSLLQGVGIRHLRDGTPAGNASLCAEEATLASAGIHMNVLTDGSEADEAEGIACLGATAESAESINEPDLNDGPGWTSTVWTNTEAMAAGLPAMPILAPAVTSIAAEQALGSMTSVISDGNAHAYFAGRNPGTPGWGAVTQYGTYGSIAYNLGVSAIVSGTKPVAITESGYSDAVDQYALPAVTKARYVVRTTLEAFNAGAARTFIYELADEGQPQFSHYGIVDASGNPKPVYVALQSLIATLSDPGGTFAVSPLNYNFAAAPSVHHTLLERRNGTYELVVWNEVPEWDPDSSSPIATSPAPVDLTFAKPPSSITATTFGDNGTLTTSTVASSQIVTLNASNWPTIIDIKP
jgi:hypothetical protein